MLAVLPVAKDLARSHVYRKGGARYNRAVARQVAEHQTRYCKANVERGAEPYDLIEVFGPAEKAGEGRRRSERVGEGRRERVGEGR